MNRKGIVIPIVLLLLSMISIYSATFYFRSIKEVKRTVFVVDRIQSNLYMKSLEQLIKTKIYTGPGYFRLLADCMLFIDKMHGKEPVPKMGESGYYSGDWFDSIPDLMKLSKQAEDFKVFYNDATKRIDKNSLIKDVNSVGNFNAPLTTFLSDLNLNSRVDTSKFILSVKMAQGDFPADKDDIGVNIKTNRFLENTDQYFTSINCEMHEFIKEKDGSVRDKVKDFSFLFKLNLPQEIE
jgi:hypothetical protein